MGPGERHLALFLGQYWGGPTTYSDQRGHPRLRMRHAPFTVGRAERDAWYGHMAEAVATSGAPPEIADRLLEYFAMAADHMVNTPDLRLRGGCPRRRRSEWFPDALSPPRGSREAKTVCTRPAVRRAQNPR